MGLISMTLNCSQSDPPLPPPYPANILLCQILNQIVLSSNNSSSSDSPTPLTDSFSFSPWMSSDAFVLSSRLQTR